MPLYSFGETSEVHENGLWLRPGLQGKRSLLPILILILTGLSCGSNSEPFLQQPFPFHPYAIFDVGVVDFNGDGYLDLFSTNCNAPLNLLENDGAGGFIQKRTTMGLDHTPGLPGFGVWDAPPEMTGPGLYIYFIGRYLYIQSHEASGLAPFKGTIRLICRETISEGRDVDFSVTRRLEPSGLVSRLIEFRCGADALFKLKPDPFQTDPMWLELAPGTPLERVFMGVNKTPAPATRMEFFFPDAHTMAWADINSNGLNDVFIGRGALLGDPELTPRIQELEDRLMLNQDGELQNHYAKTQMEKNGCPSRKSAWVDANHDGLLDLFHVGARGASSRLYVRQSPKDLTFVDVAPLAGLDQMPDAGFCWRDLDMDGRMDLAVYQDGELLIFWGDQGPDMFGKTAVARISAPPWRISTVDYNRNCLSDLFCVLTDRSLLLFENNGDRTFTPVPLESLGLPGSGTAAEWCDFDNDGWQDIAILPGGLFRRTAINRFEKTDLLGNPFTIGTEETMRFIIMSWFDMDNNGFRDLLAAAYVSKNIVDPPPAREDPLFNVFDAVFLKNPGGANHWLQLDLLGKEGNRNAIGARAVVTADGVKQMQQVGDNECSRASQGHYRLYFGLGEAQSVDTIEVTWPDGTQKSIASVPVNQVLTIPY